MSRIVSMPRIASKSRIASMPHIVSKSRIASMPRIVGILNVTPDSFSDGGKYEDPAKATAHAIELTNAGAHIIDIGGESTRPGAEPTPADLEKARILPVLKDLRSRCPDIALSIDTRHCEVAHAACAAGATMINDVSGFTDPAMIEIARASQTSCVLMHMAGEPQTMQIAPAYDDVLVEVGDYLLEGAARLEAAGVPQQRIILDPGFGFGKSKEHSLSLFLRFKELAKRVHSAGAYRLLIGLSRKRIIADLFGIEHPPDRDQASAELGAALSAAGAAFVRVHNPGATVHALTHQSAAPRDAYIALGSNRGNRRAQLETALRMLDALPLTQVSAVATPVLSEPAYDTDQQPFINTVCRLSTQLGVHALFAYTQAIEQAMGRAKTRVNGPRVIDLDVLACGDECINLPSLTIPHARLTERAFVVEPLREIAPDFCLPDGRVLDPGSAVQGRIIRRLKPLKCDKLATEAMASQSDDEGEQHYE